MKLTQKIKNMIEELTGKKELKKELEKQSARLSLLSQKLEETQQVNFQLNATVEEFMFLVSELLERQQAKLERTFSEFEEVSSSEELPSLTGKMVQTKQRYDLN